MELPHTTLEELLKKRARESKRTVDLEQVHRLMSFGSDPRAALILIACIKQCYGNNPPENLEPLRDPCVRKCLEEKGFFRIAEEYGATLR